MNKNIKKIISIILAAVLLIMTFASCGKSGGNEEESTTEQAGESLSLTDKTYSATTENVKKSETVYANLDSSGKVKQVTVSDWLHSDKAQVSISDSTTLKNFTVTKGSASNYNENGDITWQMGTSDVYYQGSSAKDLPVSVNYSYKLDGSDISAEDLAGKSGKVQISVNITNLVSKQVTIDGKQTTIYSPLIAVGGMLFPYENFSNINVTNGMSVGMGNNEIVMFGGVPGINDSLQLDSLNGIFKDYSFYDTYTITADVKNFSLGDTYLAILPVGSLSGDIELPQTLEDVKNIISEVSDYSAVLDEIDPNNLLKSFISNDTNITEALNIIKQASSLYSNNKELLQAFSKYLTPENLKALSKLSDDVSSENMQSLLNLLSDVPQLKNIVGTLTGLSEDLNNIQPILEGIQSELNDPKVAAELQNLPQTMNQLTTIINYVNKNQELINVLAKLLSSKSTSELASSLENLLKDYSASGTSEALQNIDSRTLVARMNEWLKLDYRMYTSAPEYMKTSCMFILKTDPIK